MEKSPNIAQILQKLEIEKLNLMQEAAHKAILSERDVFLLSPTGSGKTLAFLLPIFQLLSKQITGIQCLIISPTRELAIQIESVWKKMGSGYKINACYGGHDMTTEIQNLKTAPAILVGTPGRISDHIERKTIELENINILVLDEFDKSLAMGFEEEMSYVVGKLKNLQKRVMVSATAKVQLPKFMGEIKPKVLNFTLEEEKTTDQLQLKTIISEQKDKIERLYELLCFIGSESTLIFCNHREATERTVALLKEKGIESIAFFHGGMEQLDRERALIQFRNGSHTFLVATDLAARGLDIPEVKHVVHYHFPLKREEFIHRNGRTARMNAEGNSYLLLYRNEPNPDYLGRLPELLDFSINPLAPLASEWSTLYISGGRKDKLNKVDIVGFLSKKGELEKGDLGLIEVMDFMSFVAVKKLKINNLLKKISAEKMKGKKYKIELAK
ncbi:MAG: DEAD/DEAH box helicase [Bacteroidota bacterium]